MNTNNEKNKLSSSSQQHCVIKKGRFEVRLSGIDSNMTTNSKDQPTDGVLEWKRKGKNNCT
jgi:hypothetical protein